MQQDMDEAGLFQHIGNINISPKRLEELLIGEGLDVC
jgi:hypothetical protein